MKGESMIYTIGEQKHSIDINSYGTFVTLTKTTTSINYQNILATKKQPITKEELQGMRTILNATKLPYHEEITEETFIKVQKILTKNSHL